MSIRSLPAPMRIVLGATAWLALAALAPTFATATEIARWTFDDGTANDTFGAYDFTPIGGGPAISGGTAVFDGDDGSPSYLESSGYGGSPSWTLVLRVRVQAPFDQGTYQGLFSNNTSPSADYSWQVESFDGRYQFRTRSGVFDFGAPTGGWDTIVVRKQGGSDGDIWLNGVQVVSSFGHNPGGLQSFRFGTNRNTSRFYAFEADYARVFDTYEDATVIPEPKPSLMLLGGLVFLGYRRTRTRPDILQD